MSETTNAPWEQPVCVYFWVAAYKDKKGEYGPPTVVAQLDYAVESAEGARKNNWTLSSENLKRDSERIDLPRNHISEALRLNPIERLEDEGGRQKTDGMPFQGSVPPNRASSTDHNQTSKEYPKQQPLDDFTLSASFSDKNETIHDANSSHGRKRKLSDEFSEGLKEKHEIDDIAAGSRPLTIYDPGQYVSVHADYPETLGVLKLRGGNRGSPRRVYLSKEDGGCLSISYSNSFPESASTRKHGLPPDIAAVIARAFLLTTITFYRRRAREILEKFQHDLEKAEKKSNSTAAPKSDAEPKPDLAPAAKLSWLARSWRWVKGKLQAGAIPGYLAATAAALRDFAQPNRFMMALVWASVIWVVWVGLFGLSPEFIDCPRLFEPHYATRLVWFVVCLITFSEKKWPSGSDLKEWISQPKKLLPSLFFSSQISGIATLPGALFIWLSWPRIMYASHEQTSAGFDTIVMVLIAITAFTFLLVAGNFETPKHKAQIKAHKDAKESFDKLLSDLAQTNANVTALHFNRRVTQGAYASESLLRKLDEALHIKEAVVSLESVIRSRQRYVHDSVEGLLENQQQVRRTVMGAGSGMVAGYITFDVGSSVMKYLDLPNGLDENSYNFWLTTQARPGLFSIDELSNEPLVDCGLDVLPYPAKNGDAQVSQLEFKLPQSKCETLQEIAAYRAKYHEDELMDFSLLLVITFFVSLAAAWVASRKPEQEH